MRDSNGWQTRALAAETALASVSEELAATQVLLRKLTDDFAAEQLRSSNLEIAVASARRVSAAVGIVMARCAVTYDRAFEMLSRQSQNTHVKLREVAERILLEGDLP